MTTKPFGFSRKKYKNQFLNLEDMHPNYYEEQILSKLIQNCERKVNSTPPLSYHDEQIDKVHREDERNFNEIYSVRRPIAAR